MVAVASLVVLGLSALVEASFSVVSRTTLRSLIEEHAAASRVQSLVDRPQSVRAAMLTIELVSASVLAVVATSFVQRELDDFGLLIATVLIVLLILLVGRAIPMALVAGDQHDEPPSYDRLAAIVSFVGRPATLIVDLAIRLLTPLLSRRSSPPDEYAVDDMNGRVEPALTEEPDLEEDEHEMISGVLHLDEATAREIMVPRPDIIAVPVDMPVIEVVDVARDAGHSRIPVYRESIDSIVGVVYAKDFLRFVREDLTSVKLLELLRPAYFVPESKRVDELLKDLRQERTHLAVVVDEYGGTAGLVTIEDILEEIVGEIQDEYDTETPLVERLGPTEVIVDGRIGVDELGDIFDTELPEREYGTVGGFVQKQLGRIPQAGESVRIDGLLIEVQAVEHRRVRKLRVTRVEEPQEVLDGDAATID